MSGRAHKSESANSFFVFAEQTKEKEGQQRRGESVELPITTELVRFFANLAGNLTSFSAQDSEETGGNGLLACSLPDGNKEDEMPTGISNGMSVITLDINEMGQMKKRLPRLTQEEQLENTLLQGLYPGIRVARLNVPLGKLEDHQENEVQKSMRCFELDGVRFRLVGASASAKSGKFYAVDERYEPAIAERFRKWPEAAITYFGILVSPCKQRIQLPDAKVMVVKDRTLGTNDCRGWISRSVFERFHLPGHRLYQFRLAFGNTQAKGACKVMADDVARRLESDNFKNPSEGKHCNHP